MSIACLSRAHYPFILRTSFRLQTFENKSRKEISKENAEKGIEKGKQYDFLESLALSLGVCKHAVNINGAIWASAFFWQKSSLLRGGGGA